MAGAELPRLLQIAGGRDHHPGLALDRLDQEGDGVGGDGRFQSGGVAIGNHLEARAEGTEPLARLRVGGEADDGQGAAMEVVCADDDLRLVLGDALDLIAPLAGHLEGAFHRLGAGVHRQGLVRPGEGAQLLVEGRELVVAEGAGGQAEAAGLLDQGLADLRVAVPLVHRRIGREAVEVAPALHVPDIDPLASGQDHVQGLVVPGPEAGLQVDQGGGIRRPLGRGAFQDCGR